MLASDAHFLFNHRFYRRRWAYDILRVKGDERGSEAKRESSSTQKERLFAAIRQSELNEIGASYHTAGHDALSRNCPATHGQRAPDAGSATPAGMGDGPARRCTSQE
jgi:hypothetical protein